MLGQLRRFAKARLDALSLSEAAKLERRRDRDGFVGPDPGTEAVVPAAVEWLCRAQDRSASNDGGVARHFSLIDGWSTSYPETTGYIIPTLLHYARRHGDEALAGRARRMLDWLVSIQFSDGSFQGGRIDSLPCVPVSFNTGQILFGLVSGVEHLGADYLEPMRRAARWLVDTQDPDGAWRRHLSPFAPAGEHAYATHSSYALLEAARLDPDSRFREAALTNVRWAVSLLEDDGWLPRCSLSREQDRPQTHTLGYALRGVLEAYRVSEDDSLLHAGRKLADGILRLLSPDGFLPGVIGPGWEAESRHACLTGTAQVAHGWLLLYLVTGERAYREAGFRANAYVRRTIRLDGAPDVRGAVKGSFPVDGDYCPYEYPNWAAKFVIDSNLMEQDIATGAIEPRVSRPDAG